MNKIINIKIYNDNELIYTNNDVNSNYVKDYYIEYEDDYGIHNINLMENIYRKENNKDKMIIDFNNNTCLLETSEGYNLEFKIISKIIKYKNKLILQYDFDKNIIKILIESKE